MKRIILISLSIVLFPGIFAQKFDLDFYKTYPELGSYGLGKAILLTEDDSIVIAGESANYHIFFMKTDENGDKGWAIQESPLLVDAQNVQDMIVDNEGNYVMVGWHGPSSYTYFYKVSPQGDSLAVTIDGGQFGYGPGFGVVQTLDKGFFIASDFRDYSKGELVALRKVNNSGESEWSKTFFGGQASTIKKKSNTEYYMTGYRDYYKGSGVDGDVFLMKLNVNGDSVWTKIYKKDGTSEFGNDLLILPDNAGFLICGTEPDSLNLNYTQGFLLKADINGNVEWKKEYTRVSPSYTSFLKMKLNPHGDIVLMAMTNGGSSDLTLLKYNLDGKRLQLEHFDFKLNENYGDLVINDKGDIFVTGSTASASLLKIIDHCPLDPVIAYLMDPELNLGDDVYVAMDKTMNGLEYKLVNLNTKEVVDSADGNGTALYLNAGSLTRPAESDTQMYIVRLNQPTYHCSKSSDTLFVVLSPTGTKALHNLSGSVFPNPANKTFTIRYSLHQTDRITIDLTDLQGRMIQQLMLNEKQNAGTYQEQFPVTDKIVSGTYFIRIKSSSAISTLRLIIR